MNKTTLAKYVWELKQKHNITPTLKWYIVKSIFYKSKFISILQKVACYDCRESLKF